jgi:hypothetical protein
MEQTLPNVSDTNQTRLKEILSLLTLTQIRFLIARNETKSDREAGEMIGLNGSSVKHWNEDGSKRLVDEAVKLMAHDGVMTALEIRRRSLAKAMAVKAAGLEEDDPKVRQAAATEIIEWELGKATNKTEISGEVKFVWDHNKSE